MLYDLLFLIIMGVALLLGYSNGFLKAFFSFIGVIASAFGGFLLYPYISPVIAETFLYGFFFKMVSGFISSGIKEEGIGELMEKYRVGNLDELINSMAAGVTDVIMNILSIFIILLIIKIVVSLLKRTSKWLNNVPVIGLVNRFLGMAVSGASALVVIYIIVAVMLIPPSNQTELSKQMCQGINSSVVVSRVMDYNFFISYKTLSKVD